MAKSAKELDDFFGVTRYPLIVITRTKSAFGLDAVFGLIDYMRVNTVAALRIFGIPVYRRVGDIRNVCGITLPRMRDNAS